MVSYVNVLVVNPHMLKNAGDPLKDFAPITTVAYVPFAGEGHGFRKAENIKRALECELSFFGQVFGFAPADIVGPVSLLHG